MASTSPEKDLDSFSYDQLLNDHYSHSWNVSRTRIQLRLTLAKTIIRDAQRDVQREVDESIAFLRKAFASNQEDLPIMQASIYSMVASLSQEFDSLPWTVNLVNKEVTPPQPEPANDPNVPNQSGGDKRVRESETQSVCPSKRQKLVPAEQAQTAKEVADRARGQWQGRDTHESTHHPSHIYIMPDITPKISRAEVEAQHWVFRYPAHGPGYFIIRCHWGPCTKVKSFIRHPFERGQAMEHFNDPHNKHGKDSFTEAEIMKTFALQVEDAADDWVVASNAILSRPSPGAGGSQALTARKPKNKALASRSTTKTARKPTIRCAEAEPYYPPMCATPPTSSGPQTHAEPDDCGNQSGGSEEASLDEIRVQP